MTIHQKIVKIINNHSTELAADEILLLFGVSNNEERVSVCDWCGEERIVNEDNSCKCCECLDKEQTDC